MPGDRYGLRERLRDSLDEIYAEKYDRVIDSCESKVFGIGLESMTVGSNEFYLAYAATHPGVYDLLDLGHFHPTENVADKLSALLLFFDKVPMHVTRPVRWDSDHVVLFDDPTKEVAMEIAHIPGAWEKVIIGLDFFDASINPRGRLGHGHARHGEVAAVRAAAAGRAPEGAAGHLSVHREDDAGRAGEVDALRRRVGRVLPPRRRPLEASCTRPWPPYEAKVLPERM